MLNNYIVAEVSERTSIFEKGNDPQIAPPFCRYEHSGDEGEDGSGMSDGGSSEMANMAMPRWSKVEDNKLKSLVEQHGENWAYIGELMKTRTDAQCEHRWTKVVNPSLIKGPWTKEVSGRGGLV